MNPGAYGVGRGCCGKSGSVKSLIDGQLPSSKTTLYTVPPGTTTCVTQITLVNTDGSARTVNIYFKAQGGTSRRIFPMNLSLDSGSEALWSEGDILGMEEGDQIEGDASLAAVIDYVISGVEHRG